jgi:hypothetical protein
MLVGFIGVSQPRRHALTLGGAPVPNDVRVSAMVDTGASCTCVDPTVLLALGLSPTGTVPMLTPSTGPTPVDTEQFDVSLRIVSREPGDALVRPTIAVACSELLFQGFHVLLGRDILQSCLLTYDGLNGSFSFAY